MRFREYRVLHPEYNNNDDDEMIIMRAPDDLANFLLRPIDIQTSSVWNIQYRKQTKALKITASGLDRSTCASS